MTIIKTVKEMQHWADIVRQHGQRIGFVPTMGCLHEGHLSLVRVAREKSDFVVVSIFVNPLQFGPKEDFNIYPRDFARDQLLLSREGVDVIYHPGTTEMYPLTGGVTTPLTYVNVERLTENLCGCSRPGHFRGVTTVVAKLFNAVKPHVAVFGAKDAQQSLVIKRMTQDLDFDVEIIVAPTVREPDGLAMSSRNRNLKPKHRKEAPTLYQALQLGHDLITMGIARSPPRSSRLGASQHPRGKLGVRDPKKVIAAMTDMIGETSGRIDYISIVDTTTLQDVKRIKGEVLIALAVYYGKVRLIDSIIVPVP